MSANAAVIIARLGGKASWCGRLGDDARGRQILEGLHEENVDASAARSLPGASSPHSIVLVDSEGRRALVLHRPLFDDAQTDWLPLGEIDRVDAVLADNRWVPGARTLLQAARARGVPAVLDADVGTGAETIEAVRAATHRFFSGAALAYLYGRPDPEEGLRQAARDCRFVSVTLGQEGARWLDAHGAFCTQPAFPVDAVETGGPATFSTAPSRWRWSKRGTRSKPCVSPPPPPRSNAAALAAAQVFRTGGVSKRSCKPIRLWTSGRQEADEEVKDEQ